MYVDRDGDNNIISIYARPQRDEKEFIEVEAMKAKLNAQPFQWSHGYD